MLERTGKISEAATLGVLQKRLFLRFSQNSQEDTCVRASFLLKLQASGLPSTSLKRRLWHSCFSMKFAKILRNTNFEKHLRTIASGDREKYRNSQLTVLVKSANFKT